MPRLWDDTVDAHRRAVREATLDATAALVAEHGLRGVTMSKIAAAAGIGRATLYKYFPDVEAVLLAWHERQVTGHLEELAALRDRARDPASRLEAVLEAYAAMHQGLAAHHRGKADHAADLVALLHRGAHVARAERRVVDFMRGILAEATAAGAVRTDVPLDELVAYCLQTLGGAGALSSKAAVRRLVGLTLAALRPPG